MIGVPAPDEYLEMMGFAIITNEDGGKDLLKVGEAKVDAMLTTTNLSVEDVLEHCYACGLGMRPAAARVASPNVTMSFAAAPSITTEENSRKQQMIEEVKSLPTSSEKQLTNA